MINWLRQGGKQRTSLIRGFPPLLLVMLLALVVILGERYPDRVGVLIADMVRKGAVMLVQKNILISNFPKKNVVMSAPFEF